ncbi:hypothetical protein [Tenacibaculum sp. 190524A02b]|uniref:hypothetical protein n=1 Tax=Tenacibaculum vairaonense TaxID=3137860 RepID=UPI0031FA6C87
MKKLVYTLAMFVLGMQAQAQTTVITEKDGKVGIGTTDPKSKLEIATSTLQDAFIIGSGQDGGKIYTSYESGSGYLNFVEFDDPFVLNFTQTVGDGFNEKIYFHQSNFGIGKIKPGQKLFVNGKLGISDHFTSYRPGSNTFLRFDDAGYTGIGSGSTLSSGANVLLYGKSSSRTDVIAFRNSTGEKVVISKDGKVGIGTGLPASKLHVHYSSAVGEISKNGLVVTRHTQTTGNVTSHDKGISSSIGNFSIPAGATDLGYKIGLDASSFASTTNFKGTLRSNYGIWARAGVHQATSGAKINYAAAIEAQVLDNIEGVTIENVYGIKISTNDYKKATVNNRYDIYAGTEAAKNYFAGKVGIGTTKIPTDYKLAVDGKIGAREIKVESRAWPDYVFTKDYNLLTLKEVENHIKEKGHLPNIPSAKEVEVNKGIELGEMNRKLLEKVEELTLYTIQQEKQLKKQSEELNELKKLVQGLVKTKK